MGTVTATVIREPLDAMGGLLIVKTPLHALDHHVRDHLAGDSTGGSDPGHHLAIAGVECKGHANAVPGPAGDLEDIRRRAQFCNDPPFSAQVRPLKHTP